MTNDRSKSYIPGESCERTWTKQTTAARCSSNTLSVISYDLPHSRQAALSHQQFQQQHYLLIKQYIF